ncbi:hypothetical protein CYMTET_13479 [Cymbomonas tetramitiformis]|uniref:Excinuclease ABC subunit B n=1 Tax=Cymbomonas tetramitiformis TaxID=36881 RepID=A0AAE0GIE4_9CHLO|nr:hypothetical protein CYMTET_13479 [Cymbomonas tetramitiformis]
MRKAFRSRTYFGSNADAPAVDARSFYLCLTSPPNRKLPVLCVCDAPQGHVIGRFVNEVGAERASEKLEGLQAIGKVLDLPRLPYHIEAYDISHLHGTGTAAGQAVLNGGLPALDGYGYYPILTSSPADDCAALAEAMRRRFGEQPDGVREPPPHLVIIDGGRGQLSAVTAALTELQLEGRVRVAALAKSQEQLFVPGRTQPIRLPRSSPAMLILRRARDEAHAAANLGHGALRGERVWQSCLDGVAGVGMAKQSALLAHFRTEEALRKASLAQLALVPGIGPTLAAKVHWHLRGKDGGVVAATPSLAMVPLDLRGAEGAADLLVLQRRAGLKKRREASGVEAQRRAAQWWEEKRSLHGERTMMTASMVAVTSALCIVLQSAVVRAATSSQGRSLEDSRQLLAAMLDVFSPARSFGLRDLRRDPLLPDPLLEELHGVQDGAVRKRLQWPVHVRSFDLRSEYSPHEDQAQAIQKLVAGVVGSEYSRFQVLKGATGTGKTFVMANLIHQVNRPTLVLAPNKVLAGQLYNEFKRYFPNNRVEYFVSFYDYYRPESYKSTSDTYIEKSSQVNRDLQQMRHSATLALVERSDTIVVASVSCIYGLGVPEEILRQAMQLQVGDGVLLEELEQELGAMGYIRQGDVESVEHGGFVLVRIEGPDALRGLPGFSRRDGTGDPHPPAALLTMLHPLDGLLRVHFEQPPDEDRYVITAAMQYTWHDTAERLEMEALHSFAIYPARQHMVRGAEVARVADSIEEELESRVEHLLEVGRNLEATRLRSRVRRDLEDLRASGTCPGVENYSRHLAGAAPFPPSPAPPPCLSTSGRAVLRSLAGVELDPPFSSLYLFGQSSPPFPTGWESEARGPPRTGAVWGPANAVHTWLLPAAPGLGEGLRSGWPPLGFDEEPRGPGDDPGVWRVAPGSDECLRSRGPFGPAEKTLATVPGQRDGVSRTRLAS